MTQWYELVVHLCTNTMAAKEGVNGEGKVEGRTVSGQRTDLSFRSEHEDLTGKKVQFDGVKEVHSVWLWVVEDFLDGTEPFVQLCLVLRVFLFHTILVLPVSGKTLLCNLVHTV